MKRKILIIILATLALMGVFISSCGKDKIVERQVYLLYRDIYGNAEFEEDGNYPPPDNLDNFYDGLITVTLRFGETIDIFDENDVYGYFITTDDKDVNYAFKFVPSGNYWLEAELTIADSCFYVKTDKFYLSDTTDVVKELRPVFLGLNMNCFTVTLSGVSEGECVQVEGGSYVTKEVYERFYKGRNNLDVPTAP